MSHICYVERGCLEQGTCSMVRSAPAFSEIYIRKRRGTTAELLSPFVLSPFAHPKTLSLPSLGCSSLKSAGGWIPGNPSLCLPPPCSLFLHPFFCLSGVCINRINICSYTKLGCKLHRLSSLVLQGIHWLPSEGPKWVFPITEYCMIDWVHYRAEWISLCHQYQLYVITTSKHQTWVSHFHSGSIGGGWVWRSRAGW